MEVTLKGKRSPRPKARTEIDFSSISGISMFQKEQVNRRGKVYTVKGEMRARGKDVIME